MNMFCGLGVVGRVCVWWGGGGMDKSGKVSTWAVTGRSIGLMHSLVGYDVFSQDSSPT